MDQADCELGRLVYVSMLLHFVVLVRCHSSPVEFLLDTSQQALDAIKVEVAGLVEVDKKLGNEVIQVAIQTSRLQSPKLFHDLLNKLVVSRSFFRFYVGHHARRNCVTTMQDINIARKMTVGILF